MVLCPRDSAVPEPPEAQPSFPEKGPVEEVRELRAPRSSGQSENVTLGHAAKVLGLLRFGRDQEGRADLYRWANLLTCDSDF